MFTKLAQVTALIARSETELFTLLFQELEKEGISDDGRRAVAHYVNDCLGEIFDRDKLCYIVMAGADKIIVLKEAESEYDADIFLMLINY